MEGGSGLRPVVSGEPLGKHAEEERGRPVDGCSFVFVGGSRGWFVQHSRIYDETETWDNRLACLPGWGGSAGRAVTMRASSWVGNRPGRSLPSALRAWTTLSKAKMACFMIITYITGYSV